MRNLRKKVGNKVKEQMAMSHKSAFVLDSSHVIGVQRIMQFLEDRKRMKAERQARIEKIKKDNERAAQRRLQFARKEKPESKS